MNNTNNTANTTIYNMTVTYGAETFAPAIEIADNGVWRIVNHEAFRACVGIKIFDQWIMDFWTARGTIKGGEIAMRDFARASDEIADRV